MLKSIFYKLLFIQVFVDVAPFWPDNGFEEFDDTLAFQ